MSRHGPPYRCIQAVLTESDDCYESRSQPRFEIQGYCGLRLAQVEQAQIRCWSPRWRCLRLLAYRTCNPIASGALDLKLLGVHGCALAFKP